MQYFEEVFNWKFQRCGNEEYWFEITRKKSPGINGAIMKKRDPNQPITNSIAVDIIDGTMPNMEKFGG